MEILDNINRTVRDDLAATVTNGGKLSVAAACFSIYAYQALKRQLDGIDELRFIFTSPTFLQERAPKEKHEFYIPRLNRERSLFPLIVFSRANKYPLQPMLLMGLKILNWSALWSLSEANI